MVPNLDKFGRKDRVSQQVESGEFLEDSTLLSLAVWSKLR